MEKRYRNKMMMMMLMMKEKMMIIIISSSNSSSSSISSSSSSIVIVVVVVIILIIITIITIESSELFTCVKMAIVSHGNTKIPDAVILTDSVNLLQQVKCWKDCPY